MSSKEGTAAKRKTIAPTHLAERPAGLRVEDFVSTGGVTGGRSRTDKRRFVELEIEKMLFEHEKKIKSGGRMSTSTQMLGPERAQLKMLKYF